MAGAASTSNGIAWLIVRPLPAQHVVLAAAALVAAGTLYCQLYCAIAYQPMRGMPMPLGASLSWAATAILPWFAAFELAKRLPPGQAGLARIAAILGLFLVAAFLSIVTEAGVDRLIGVHGTRPLPMQIAVQMPAAAIVALLLTARGLAGTSPAARPSSVGGAIADILELGESIDWIEAAGNYVQVHAGGRTSLHRITMRELEQALDPARFARIHRSAIVHCRGVEARIVVDGSPAVRLRDGSLLKVGDRYAGNLGRIAV